MRDLPLQIATDGVLQSGKFCFLATCEKTLESAARNWQQANSAA